MSLATGKAQLKTALQNLRAVSDEEYEDAIDDFIDALETWIKGSTVTIPAGTIQTTGTAAAQTQSVPGVVNDAIS